VRRIGVYLEHQEHDPDRRSQERARAVGDRSAAAGR
jgi:hypothetical protein